MNTKIGLAVAASLVTPQIASADILLAGIHGFDNEPAKGPLDNPAVQAADEGLFAADSGISYRNASTATGGSTDNWYGPDSSANGGVMTGQLPFDATPFDALTNPDGTTDRISVGGFSANGPNGLAYLPEVSGPNPRLDPTYDDDSTLLPVPQATVDTLGGPVASTADGRIANINGSDFIVANNSNETYFLTTFVFDSFVGDASTNASSQGQFEDFTFEVTVNGNTVTNTLVGVNRGYAGYNNQRGDALDDPLAPASTVDNLIDYGFGTNYLDFVVNLGRMPLAPGETISIGLNSTSQTGAVLRGDNFALVAVVPEPSSALALGGLLGLGMFSRRRR